MRNDRPSSTAWLIAAGIAYLGDDPELGALIPAGAAETCGSFVRACSARGAPFLRAMKVPMVRLLIRMVEWWALPGVLLHYVLRKRFLERIVRTALKENFQQVVVLGGGFDTLALRLQKEFPDVTFMEVDHPATQGDKRRRLAEAQIAEPRHVAYVAHDFEHGSMTAALEAGGLNPTKRTFVLWLGVTPYLTEDAVFATLGELARLPGGVEVAFDYANPPHAVEEAATRNFHREMAERVAASGEPFRCYLDTGELHARALSLGFAEIEDLDRAALVKRYLPLLPVAPRSGPGGHVVRMAAVEAVVNCGRASAAYKLSCAAFPAAGVRK